MSTTSTTQRVPYREAGEAHRACHERMVAVADKLTKADLLVFAAVMALVPSYSRTSEATCVDEIAKRAAVHPKTAAKSLRRLHDAGVWTWTSSNARRADSVIVLERPEGKRKNIRPKSVGAALTPTEADAEGVAVAPSSGSRSDSTTEKYFRGAPNGESPRKK